MLKTTCRSTSTCDENVLKASSFIPSNFLLVNISFKFMMGRKFNSQNFVTLESSTVAKSLYCLYKSFMDEINRESKRCTKKHPFIESLLLIAKCIKLQSKQNCGNTLHRNTTNKNHVASPGSPRSSSFCQHWNWGGGGETVLNIQNEAETCESGLLWFAVPIVACVQPQPIVDWYMV